MYSEPDIVVSQFPLDNVHKKDVASNVVIHLSKQQILQAVEKMGSPVQ